MIIILEGPDNCGKTEIAKELARRLCLSYFKVSTEKENWRRGTFSKSLYFDFVLPQFIRVLPKADIVFDRSYISEKVYSKVFGRDTDEAMLQATDDQFNDLGAVLIVCLRRDYSGLQDELVSNDKLIPLHDEYSLIHRWTRLPVVYIYVDDFGNDIRRQSLPLVNAVLSMQNNEKIHTITLENYR